MHSSRTHRHLSIRLGFVSALALGVAILAPGAFACGLQDASSAPASLPEAAAQPAAAPEATPLETEADVLCALGLAEGTDMGLTNAGSCCDPALEPGTGGNPFCFEGHTCCSDGKWRCNNADGTPSCPACGSSCVPSGGSCASNAVCCSGTCKNNHRCR